MRIIATLLICLVACAAPDGGGAVDDATDAGAPDAPPPVWPDAPPGDDPHLLDAIDELSLVVVIGDSLAAGYNAPGGNGVGGRGFARLLVTNHGSMPGFDGHDLATRWPAVMFKSVADSGAQSGEALASLESALAAGGALPAEVPGDVLVLINVGGNDFNDNPAVMIDAGLTAQRAQALRANLAEMIALLGERYHDPASGRTLLVLVNDIYDPTDGQGTVPAQFHDGFCDTIQNPIFTAPLREMALANLATMNDAIAAEAAAQGAHLVGVHDAFLGRGMNGGAYRLLDDDCAHATAAGHDFIRRLIWDLLTGERYP